MSGVFASVRRHADILVKIMPLLSFAVPLLLLFLLNPFDPYLNLSAQDSFQLMWKGRTFQLFFIWLIALEFILSWESFKLKVNRQNKPQIIALAVASILPTIYVLFENYFGLSGAIADASMKSGITFYNSMPLATEYLVFGVLFCLTTFLYLGKKGLTGFALPAFFVVLVGVIYTIDNVFPYGQFTPFQLLVPTTTVLAAKVLGFMGYSTLIGNENGMPTLQASGSLGTAKFSIAWPCAGIESLLIFTAVALLFLQQMPISWKAKAGYFAAGAAVTYFINVLRIATIFTIGMQFGVNSNQVQTFHFYYGPLYSITWIVLYPLIIMLSRSLWLRIKSRKTAVDQVGSMKHQPGQLNPV